MSDTALASPDPSNRRLAAVLASDVVGYSRMMAKDESDTLAALKRHREAVIQPAVAAHNGRVVKLMGEGCWSSSAASPTRCAAPSPSKRRSHCLTARGLGKPARL